MDRVFDRSVFEMSSNQPKAHMPRLGLLFCGLACLCSGARATTDSFDSQLKCVANAFDNLGLPNAPFKVEPARYDEGPSQFLLSTDEMPWTASYFPMDQKGIAVRWQKHAPGHVPEDFDDPGKLLEATDRETVMKRLKSLSPQQINKFSAVEKLDILSGNYDFIATKTEMLMRGPNRTPPPEWWEGFCNGVCAASINVPEPKHAVTLNNSDGVPVTFQPNDLKALASASYFFVEKYAAVGSPNRTELSINYETLPNPGVLDWALTHYLGELHKPFAADYNPGPQIWNHVVIGYTRELEPLKSWDASAGAPPGVKYSVIANVHIKYTGDDVSHQMGNHPTAPIMANGRMIESRYYRYRLYLDENKKIVGGEWPDSKTDPSQPTVDAPDFLWFPAGRGTDSSDGYNPYINFDRVIELIRDSTH